MRKSPRLTWAALAIALLCGACAAPSKDQSAASQPLQMPAAWNGPANPASSLAERPFGAVFKDAELEALIKEALSNNRDLRIAAQRVELARAQWGVQNSARWPSLAADAGATRQQAPSGLSATENLSASSYRLGLAMPAWEIDLWGRIASLSDAALSHLRASEALQHFVEVGLVSQVASGWLNLLEYDQSLQIAERTRVSRAGSLRIVKLRFNAGVVSKVDVTQAETSLAQAEAAYAQLQLKRGLQENALSQLAGRNPGPLRVNKPLSQYELPPALPAGIPSDLLKRRPDVRAAELSLAASRANVDAARKAYLPSISLTGFLGFISPQLSQLLEGDRRAYTVSPSITLPLFSGGRLDSNLQGAQAQQAIALEDYARTTQGALREVEDALLRFQRLREQQAAMQTIVRASQERLRLVDLRYVNGISSYFEVLDSQRQLFDAELQLTQLSSGTYAAVIELYRALGGGWTPQG
ncbi:efflux transporter outer membrane subunit [Roseateles oligotrophus]|uniref:Efflux transporter outer membrane subunit n=1 Tax=Roseateles oligotrophus TaxID=1769250 RepID=A0ABT2YFW4_9BURK|nr:efflux transporter outer membrane subunit [Roseateles oligotrophus]MCV2368927.1 efflux transporter outer membrane subunit [Roseateles oligotrophus]